MIPKSYDVVGDILIFSEFPDNINEKKIGNSLIEQLKNVEVVVKKTRKYTGKYRLPKYKIIAGARRKTTIHKESKCQFKLHIEKTYFSSRLSTERLRISNQIKKGESVLVMFSGCSPYPIVISKNSPANEIIGIEINPDAHKFALENLQLNKTSNVKLYCGDVSEVLPKIKKKFDRIIMPLPKQAEDFLPLALKHLNKGNINYYTFGHEEDIANIKKKIKSICKNCTIKKITKCGQFSPRVYRLCFDISISNK